MRKTIYVLITMICGVLLGAAAVMIWHSRFPQPATFRIAIVDTGIDPSNEALKSNVAAGWNTVSKNTETMDRAGHGTAVAERILEVARPGFPSGNWLELKILPIKVSEQGSAARASDFVSAIRFALAQKVDLLHFSMGVIQGSAELTSALTDAAQAGMLIVAAAGAGIPNPFKPMAVNSLHPQSDSRTLVVSAAQGRERADLLSNTGLEIDISTLPAPHPTLGPSSSLSAAEVSGAIARWVSARAVSFSPLPNPRRLGATLRAWSQPLLPGENLEEMIQKMGFGILDPKASPGETPAPLVVRSLNANGGANWIEASSLEALEKIAGEWKCPDGSTLPASVSAAILAKGRAVLRFPARPNTGCNAEVSARTASGETISAQVGF